ncbi:MAG: SH3 domain-containing protein, partial [Firmicutes bacterium]|nr:SH3 domain-containing protein [Bacillota bacterium]
MGTSRERYISARGIAGSFLIFLIIVNLTFGASAFVFADSNGFVNATDGLNIRSGAGTKHSIVSVLPNDAEVTIIGEATDPEGVKWYQITSNYGNGYVCSYYITLKNEESKSSDDTSSDENASGSTSGYDVSYSNDEDFETYLGAQGFPESYKPYLRVLHAEHPTWRFIAMQTGLDWQEVIYRETHPVSTSLVPNSWSDSWKSREKASYDTKTGEYYIFDSGGYVAANSYGVAYYMDPRNNMASDTIFQFLSNKFDESTQNIEGIDSIAKGSYLETRDPGEGFKTYAELIYNVGKETGVNPLTIASMLILEQGRSGDSDLISGTCEGYEGYYNFFNIGAYAAGGRSAVDNGLIYAKNKGWDSPYNAIKGGAEIYANNYVFNNKSTLYFQKFNVLNGMSRVGTGQYMTAIYAASSEGKILAEGYGDSANGGISFEIPVYENMPEEACPLPTTINIPPIEITPDPEPEEQGDDSGKSGKVEDDKTEAENNKEEVNKSEDESNKEEGNTKEGNTKEDSESGKVEDDKTEAESGKVEG